MADPVAPPAATQRLLIVDDEEDNRLALQAMLTMALSLEVDTAADGAEGLQMLLARPYSLVVTDLRMPKMGGMRLIEEIAARKLPVTVLVTTGHGGVPEAVQAMRLGVYDFFVKGKTESEYQILVIQRALRERALQDEVAALRQQVQGRHSFQNVISKSEKMHDVFDLIGHVAPTASTVLIIGETGTGKEQIARAIHFASAAHRTGTFVAVNCAAVPEPLLESDLFGHEKGSFTGAVGQRIGRFEQADKGTLFLDEIGDVPLSMQVKLLRVLQERRFERVGGSKPIDIDVRVVAATHRDIEKMVKDGTFREDLFYRLNVVRIELPPLRDRPEDIPVLVSHFVQKFARPGMLPTVDPGAMQVLLAFPWPGNVRQLENAVERACVTARDGVIRAKDLPPDVTRGAKGDGAKSPLVPDVSRPLPDQLAELTAAFEKRYLRRALRKCRGHVGKCAEISGLSRRSVTEKIGLYKIEKEEFKKD